MTASAVAALAALVAAGLLLVLRGLAGTTVPLEATVADLHRPRRGGVGTEPWWLLLPLTGPLTARIQADLAVCERDATRWLQDRVRWAALVAGFCAAALIVVPTAAGATPPLVTAVATVPPGLVAGWLYARIDLHGDAARARRQVRHAVAAYLELVTILMAGGAGPESAMYLAAEAGRGPAFRHLRSALAAAQVRQEAPWAQLGPLGHRLAVADLVELGAAMDLAGGGAQVKDTLAAKAASIRFKDLIQVESEAQARSETMALPVVLMFAGFLLLLGYPALAALATP